MTQTIGTSPNLHLPRILCLHGGGVNGQVFEIQCRVIITRLKTNFRLVFMDGPFLSPAHPAIVQVFGELGPFHSWLRWTPEQQQELDAAAAAAEIRYMCRRAMDLDEGTGEWVGVLGFSQGAKIAASLLWTQEKVTQELGEDEAATSFKFGVIMAGRAPLVQLDGRVDIPRHVVDAARLSSDFDDWPETNVGPHVLSTPTLHVHGLRDPGLDQHRILFNNYCKIGTAQLVEWDGDHRIPIKSNDVEPVVSKILEMAGKCA
ncbi:serine hydrolase FSH [Thelonectria olida]|uniref:Serine hydrolase FSH n=1 Tax=Thelonectria olida TaxID=1576542 RepID=A0A9P8W440_9HYPO|nr:serine hydrolase FSH [Thelonectria olida]